jgi:hypothetical protein
MAVCLSKLIFSTNSSLLAAVVTPCGSAYGEDGKCPVFKRVNIIM